VKENAVADRGIIRLTRQTGAITVTSEPTGIAYELRPASARFALSSPDIKRGTTPANFEKLPTGEYIISLRRDGWPAYTETVVVERNATSKVTRTFSGGAVNITSVPQGATVTANGRTLGVTPLTVNDVRFGPVNYTLSMDDFHPTTVTGVVGSDKPLDLAGTLAIVDRIRKNSELDEKPVPIKTVYPQITDQSKYKGMSVVFTLIVDQDGNPVDIKVERSSNDELTDLCLQAMEQWIFKPATVRGQSVKARVAVPFVIQ
jgi:TonB family protein